MRVGEVHGLRWKGALLLALTACFAAPIQTTAAAATANDEAIGALKTAFEQQLARIVGEGDAAQQALKRDYPQILAGLQTRMQQAGNLDGWTAVNAEIKRFSAEQTVPEASAAALPADLLTLQARYRATRDDIVRERTTKTMDLVTRYLARLDDLKRNLTIAGKVDEALAVNAEIARVKTSPAVTAAEFDMAAMAGGKQPAPAVAPTPKETAQPKKTTPRATMDIGALNLPSGVKMYDRSPPASPIAGSILKSLPLSPTELGRTKRTLSVTTAMAEVSDGEVFGFANRHSSRNTARHYIRVTLRTAGTQFPFEGGTLAVQFFAKSVSSQGRISPTQVDSQVIPLPAMGTLHS